MNNILFWSKQLPCFDRNAVKMICFDQIRSKHGVLIKTDILLTKNAVKTIRFDRFVIKTNSSFDQITVKTLFRSKQNCFDQHSCHPTQICFPGRTAATWYEVGLCLMTFVVKYRSKHKKWHLTVCFDHHGLYTSTKTLKPSINCFVSQSWNRSHSRIFQFRIDFFAPTAPRWGL